MKKLHFVWMAATSLACADRQSDLGMHVIELHREDGSSVHVACEEEDGATTRRACVLSSDGSFYPQSSEEAIVVALEPPYGGYLEFKAGFELNPDGLITEGDAAPIQALATLPNVAEDEAQSRVPVSAEITREGGLLLLVEDAVPSGTRINIILEYGNLFLSWPEGSPCPDGGLGCLGYGVRFFVGEEPALAPGADEALPPPVSKESLP